MAEAALIDFNASAIVAMYDALPTRINVGGRQIFNPSLLWESSNYRLVPVVEINPSFDPVSQTSDGPVIAIAADAKSVTFTWTVRAKTATEISTDKDNSVASALNGSLYPALLTILTFIANDTRAIKTKVNAVITAGNFTTVTPFTAQEIATVTQTQVRAFIRNML